MIRKKSDMQYAHERCTTREAFYESAVGYRNRRGNKKVYWIKLKSSLEVNMKRTFFEIISLIIFLIGCTGGATPAGKFCGKF